MAKKERIIQGEVVVAASIKDAWEVWTTEPVARTFFAPDCHIDLEPGGAYEMFFLLNHHLDFAAERDADC